MTAFEAGFIKMSSECGLSIEQADHILKRALEHEGMQAMFKSLPEAQEEEEDSSDLAELVELMRQDLIDKHMSAAQHKIQL